MPSTRTLLGRPFGRRRRWAGALLIAVMATVPMIALAKPAEPQTSCGSIQARVDAAAPGSTVDLPDGCLYREAVIIKKPLTLIGDSDRIDSHRDVQIRGSDLWNSGWTQNGEGYWVKGTLPNFSSDGQCKPNTSRCKWPEQVFFDGKPLLQVASNPQSGQFAVNSDREVLLADKPAGHKVQVTVRQQWIVPRSGGVTVEGFTMMHAANPAQSFGGIGNNGHPNWVIRNNNLSYAHGANVILGRATGLKLENNDVHHGGRVGLSSSDTTDLKVLGNKFHHNNIEDFLPSWASGGLKIAQSSQALVDSNEVYNNDWNGIWVDIHSENITISNNRVHHNLKRGIHVEISDHAEVVDNMVWENGWGAPDRGDASRGNGISATASRDVKIHGNILAWNYSGVLVTNTERSQEEPIYSTVSNVWVHDNKILAKDYSSGQHFALAWEKAYTGGNLDDPAADNRGYDNGYYYPEPEGTQKRYKWVNWENSTPSLTRFNQTPGEEQDCYVKDGEGCYLSDAEKDEVVAANGIPANPEH